MDLICVDNLAYTPLGEPIELPLTINKRYRRLGILGWFDSVTGVMDDNGDFMQVLTRRFRFGGCEKPKFNAIGESIDSSVEEYLRSVE